MTEERSAGEDSFDMMVEALKNEPASTPCIFSDQMGRGRTTSGMVIASLIKEIQITTELRKMEEIDLVSKGTVDDLIAQKFESPLPRCPDDDDPFIKGEFDVISRSSSLGRLSSLFCTISAVPKLHIFSYSHGRKNE